MPELPEVETVRLGLAPAMEGYTLTQVETRRGDLRVPFPKDFVARLRGRKVKHLRRRAKYILADLDSGETLVIHLGMSGRMSVYAEGKQRKLGNYVYDTPPAGGFLLALQDKNGVGKADLIKRFGETAQSGSAGRESDKVKF